jgi:predicted acyltransferase
MTTAAAESSSPTTKARSAFTNRLISLDVFRGLVILAMLTVNNIGDHSVAGSFFSHADWKPVSLKADLQIWWQQWHTQGYRALASFPLITHCTLADYVMPLFMLIIGVAIPFSTAAAKRRGSLGVGYWLGVFKRGATLYLLGWIIGVSVQFLNWRFSDDPHRPLTFSLGMDVLQLLGTSYVVARILCILPMTPRLIVAAALLIWHWAFLRFYPQGTVPAGTFTEQHNAYAHWSIFRGIQLTHRISFGIAGMLSVPPAAATMLLGSFAGQSLLDQVSPQRNLLLAGCLCIVVGVLWAFDLPMNKPRWTPCYLVYCSGVGMLGLELLYWLIEVR